MRRHSQSQLKRDSTGIWIQFCLPPELTHPLSTTLNCSFWAPSFLICKIKDLSQPVSDASPPSHCMTFMVGKGKGDQEGVSGTGGQGEHLSFLTGKVLKLVSCLYRPDSLPVKGGRCWQWHQQWQDSNAHHYKKKPGQDFPGGPVVKTPCFQCRGCGFNLWLEN